MRGRLLVIVLMLLLLLLCFRESHRNDSLEAQTIHAEKHRSLVGGGLQQHQRTPRRVRGEDKVALGVDDGFARGHHVRIVAAMHQFRLRLRQKLQLTAR